MSIPVPAKIGKYDVVGVIGRGGMGVVYEATDPHLGRRVAIKMITGAFAENRDMLKRFTREAQSVACLQHPNIVTLYDLGALEGNPYLVMEYLDGESLEAAMSTRRQLGLLEKISVIIQVCRGLGYVHRRGVVHRDIKPANIMLCKDGGIKIFDFGIARSGDQTVTRTGEVIGTLQYMAPEQVNSRAADFRADIFSTGVVLYQWITSHLPFQGDNTAATIMKIAHEPPPPLRDFLPSYPPGLEQILLRAMAKKPEERYASADDFAFDLEDLLGQLKEELTGREMNAAASWLDKGEVYEAQGTLQRLLKVDPQHSGAIRLLREVQQRIQRLEVGKQVRELRDQAEKALAAAHFEEAQEFADRAIALDRNDTGLQQLRETILAEHARAKKLHHALDMAQAAQAEGNLEAARRAAEEALSLAPDDSQARTIHRLIAREIEERSRHSQLEGLLRDAREQIASRNFTGALEVLRQAEELDPVSPHVRSLAESALAGREDERRRKELDKFVRDIEEALDRDDFRTASEKADEAAARYPEERKLTKLRTLADRQRQLAERKQFIEEQLAMGGQLLHEGRKDELKLRLESALRQIGPEPRLQSLLATVAEHLDSQTRAHQARAMDPSEQEATRDLNLNRLTPPLANGPAELKPAPGEIRSQAGATEVLAGFSGAPSAAPSPAAKIPDTPTLAREIASASAGQPAPASSAQSAPSPVSPDLAADALTPEKLQRVERQLASLIGPLAKVLVKRAAARAAGVFELYDILAADLERDEDRSAFLARRIEVVGEGAVMPSRHAQAAAAPAPDPSEAAAARAEITPAAIENAGHVLAAHLGPIAAVLARKEARSAVSLRDLHQHLAEHVADLAERERFLKGVGFQRQPPR